MAEWISVKDRLPLPGEAVIAKMRHSIPCVCNCDYIGRWEFIGQYKCQPCRTEVTHWMPLPEPQKGYDE